MIEETDGFGASEEEYRLMRLSLGGVRSSRPPDADDVGLGLAA